MASFEDMVSRPSISISRSNNEAIKWFNNRTRALPNSINKLMTDQTRVKSHIEIGHMYFFSYDPKTKDDLPYYDRLPLIFPFNSTSTGIYGINMHYLPYGMRAKLMDALYSIISDTRFDEKTRLKLSYDVLNSTSRFKYFKPCIKQYLYSHIRSQFVHIRADEWNNALFLPVERFQKASKERVFRDSIAQIKG